MDKFELIRQASRLNQHSSVLFLLLHAIYKRLKEIRNHQLKRYSTAAMPSQALYLSRVNKRFVKKLVSFLYAAITVAMITVFVRDWTQSWQFDSSATARSRQLRSVQVYTEIELIPATAESGGSLAPATELAKTNTKTLQSTRTSTESTTSNKLPVEHKSTLTTRTPCNQHYFLLILVASAPAYFDRRRIIRQTWAFDSSINSRWKTVFLLGQTKDKNHSEQLEREEAFHGDLIRADYYEDYWNQTLKIEMGFEWADRYCSFSFLLKADDDVFINTPAVIALLNEAATPKERLYMGHLYKHPVVKRTGKWLITQEEYNETHYPDFCAGPGYILSRDVVGSFVDIFNFIPKFKIDDVYVGMLAKEAGVTPTHNAGFQTPPYLSITCVLLDNTLVRHGAVGKCLLDLFQKAMPAFS